MTYKEIYVGAIKAWGLRDQFLMVMEECAELIEACSHVLRHRDGSMDELIEEIVDAENMINQVKYMIYEREAWKKKYFKMKRQKMFRVSKLLQEE